MNIISSELSFPLISVVTVSKNCEDTIEETILSVLNQTYKNVEYIIIDGGSTDSTKSIIRKYESRISKWISESDSGIYNAMNKGASLATGIFIGFLNADDIYFPDSIKELVENYSIKGFDYTFGAVQIEDTNNNKVRLSKPIDKLPITSTQKLLMPAPHLSVFVKKTIFNQLNGFDEQFSLSSDYDFLIRLIVISKKVFYFKNPVGVFRLGGKSGSFRTHLENFLVFRKHKYSIVFSFYHTLKHLIKEVIKKIFC